MRRVFAEVRRPRCCTRAATPCQAFYLSRCICRINDVSHNVLEFPLDPLQPQFSLHCIVILPAPACACPSPPAGGKCAHLVYAHAHAHAQLLHSNRRRTEDPPSNRLRVNIKSRASTTILFLFFLLHHLDFIMDFIRFSPLFPSELRQGLPSALYFLLLAFAFKPPSVPVARPRFVPWLQPPPSAFAFVMVLAILVVVLPFLASFFSKTFMVGKILWEGRHPLPPQPLGLDDLVLLTRK
ncbi:hypothetical protein IWX50DRAFT_53609 [Phyllosticta citricarpa]